MTPTRPDVTPDQAELTAAEAATFLGMAYRPFREMVRVYRVPHRLADDGTRMFTRPVLLAAYMDRQERLRRRAEVLAGSGRRPAPAQPLRAHGEEVKPEAAAGAMTTVLLQKLVESHQDLIRLVGRCTHHGSDAVP